MKSKLFKSMILSFILIMVFSVSAFAATMPTGLSVTAGDGEVTLNWTATVDGLYNVYRSPDDTTYTKITSSPISAVTYSDTGRTNGTLYYYKITSYDGAAESTQTASVSATPVAAGSGSGSNVDFSGVALPFTVPDMLGTAVNFLTMYGQWILLALGVLFAPVLYGLAMKLVNAVRRSSN